MARLYKNMPKTESEISVVCNTKNRGVYIISNCPEKHKYTLWHVEDDGLLKISTSSNPLNFDDIIPYLSKE